MSPTTSLIRSARPAFRRSPNFFTSRATQQQQTRILRYAARRFTSTTAGTGATAGGATAAAGGPSQSWIRRMWDSPIGLKTVHFWAPVMKWALVLAGISDFYRPAEKLSLTQNAALTATGMIWTRWCLIIKPKNILLATVNFFLALVGVVQVSRILSYQYGSKGKTSAAEQVEAAKDTVVEAAAGVKKDVVDAVKS